MATGDTHVEWPASRSPHRPPARSSLLVVVVVERRLVCSLSTSTPRWTLLGDAVDAVYNDVEYDARLDLSPVPTYVAYVGLMTYRQK